MYCSVRLCEQDADNFINNLVSVVLYVGKMPVVIFKVKKDEDALLIQHKLSEQIDLYAAKN